MTYGSISSLQHSLPLHHKHLKTDFSKCSNLFESKWSHFLSFFRVLPVSLWWPIHHPRSATNSAIAEDLFKVCAEHVAFGEIVVPGGTSPWSRALQEEQQVDPWWFVMKNRAYTAWLHANRYNPIWRPLINQGILG